MQTTENFLFKTLFILTTILFSMSIYKSTQINLNSLPQKTVMNHINKLPTVIIVGKRIKENHLYRVAN